MKRLTKRLPEGFDGIFSLGEAYELTSRLADIEDILGDEYDLEKLKEIVQAEKNGMNIIIPCKFGEDVYCPDYGAFSIEERSIFGYHVVIAEKNMDVLIEVREKEENYSHWYELEDIGEKVFFSRKEAEDALNTIELVRCYECKYATPKDQEMEDLIKGKRLLCNVDKITQIVPEYGYCHKGRKREN